MNEAQLLQSIVGSTVSHSWREHSWLYLELNDLTEGRLLKDGARGNPRGDVSIFAGYSWRIERTSSILGGSEDTTKRRCMLAKLLIGKTIENVQISSHVSELSLRFSSGLWLSTFTTGRGDPDWDISFRRPNLGTLGCVKTKLKLVSEAPRAG